MFVKGEVDEKRHKEMDPSGFELMTLGSLVRVSANWANRAGIIYAPNMINNDKCIASISVPFLLLLKMFYYIGRTEIFLVDLHGMT